MATYDELVAKSRASQEKAARARELLAEDDNAAKPSEAARIDLVQSMTEYEAGVPSNPDWIIDRLVYAGGVTLFSGPPKAGKSTLLADAVRSVLAGEPMAGVWETRRAPVLLLTEESGVAVVHKYRGLGVDVLDRQTTALAGLDYPGSLAVAAEWARQHEGGLVVIDTLAVWSGVDDENDSSKATRAILAVKVTMAGTGAGVVLVHHTRKGGGEHGEGIRGSSAILATADVSGELSRVGRAVDDDRRYLAVQGRVGFPERILLGFDRGTMRYSAQDEPPPAEDPEVEEWLRAMPKGEWVTRETLRKRWARDPRTRCEKLVELGRAAVRTVKDGRASHLEWCRTERPSHPRARWETEQ